MLSQHIFLFGSFFYLCFHSFFPLFFVWFVCFVSLFAFFFALFFILIALLHYQTVLRSYPFCFPFLNFSVISGANVLNIKGISLSCLFWSFPTFSLKSSNMFCFQGQLESLFALRKLRQQNRVSTLKTTQNKTTKAILYQSANKTCADLSELQICWDSQSGNFFLVTLVAWYCSRISHVAVETFRFEPLK